MTGTYHEKIILKVLSDMGIINSKSWTNRTNKNTEMKEPMNAVLKVITLDSESHC